MRQRAMAEVERPQSGLSVASSVATISSMTLGSKPVRSVKKVHAFGKRENALRRDQNAPVVVRGWLYKQDSAGLRLWKRRWFVLSDFCLFYYRDSREETVLGSILLPSYEILSVGTKEAKNRKFVFKAEHPGMRTYHFSADTQEDMNCWIRAMNQSALAVAENNNKFSFTLPSRTEALPLPPLGTLHSSYEDFSSCSLPPSSECVRSVESLEIAHLSESQSLGQDESSGSPGRSANRPSPPTPQYATVPLPSPISVAGKVEGNAENGSSYYPRTPASQLSHSLDYPRNSYPSPSIPRNLSPLEACSPSRVNSLEGSERDWKRKQERVPVPCPSSLYDHQLAARRCLKNLPEPPASPPGERTGLVRPSRSYSLPTTPSDLSRPRAPAGMATSPLLQRNEALGAVSPKATSLTPRLHQKTRVSLGRCQASSCEELSLLDSPTLNSRSLSRPHTPVGRVDILPDNEAVMSPASIFKNHGKEQQADGSRYRGQLGRAYTRPQTPSNRYDVLPSDDPYLSLARPTGHLGRFSKRFHIFEAAEQEQGAGGDGASLPHKMYRTSNSRLQVSHHPSSPTFSQLPPLPPVSSRPASHLTPGKRLSLAALAPRSGFYKERMLQLGWRTETDMDALLTRLCGQDKLLISLEGDWGQLQAEKEGLENALDLTRLRLEELHGQEPEVMQKIWSQQRLLQDDLVHVRARLCDLAMQMEGAWQEYRVLEKELNVQRDTLEHLHRTGHPQEQVTAQRDLWMIDDIVSGLKANKNNFHMIHEPARHPPLFIPTSPVLDEPFGHQRGFLQLSDLESPRPRKKPGGPAAAQGTSEPAVEALEAGGTQSLENCRVSTEGDSLSMASQDLTSPCIPTHPGSLPSRTICPQIDGDPDAKVSSPGRGHRQRMSAEEQLERMRRHREAQIPERVKPPRRRVPPPRSSVGECQSRFIGKDPQPTGSDGTQVNQLTTRSLDAQEPTLVTVTASYFPPVMAARGKTRASVGPQGRSEETESVVMPEDGTSLCRCRELMPAPSLVRPGSEAPAAPPQANNRSQVAAGLNRASQAAPQQSLGYSMLQLIPDQYHVAAYCCVAPKPPPSPQQLEARRRLVDGMATMVPRSSSGPSPETQAYCLTPEGERKRIMNLSYTLAAEASQLSKLMMARTLTDSGTHNDSWTLEGTKRWRPSPQEDLPHDTSAYPDPKSGTASSPIEAKEPANHLAAQYANLYSRTAGSNAPLSPGRDLAEANGCPNEEGPPSLISVSDRGYCDQWVVEEGNQDQETVAAGGEADRVAKWVSECNGEGVPSGIDWKDTDAPQVRIAKMLGYLKDTGEQPVRVTLLQSSF